ncbi:hypothetical protein PVAG01_11430 [Phlyctema vagabunda]|uniref:Transcription factor domain-containing protein n=1 Tax=Phlyctema vagabunda TaxID=108571 RepID=A0ABR4P2A9_9HELO
MRYSDSCIEIAISLDCLNDLQLFLQYENFILHSFVEGDQSYHSWRRLGDVASSIFALGYHEEIEDNVFMPPFLKELRWAAFARAYSGDKNVSIFLGRPPRILRKYCRLEYADSTSQTESISGYASQKHLQWPTNAKFDYMADTRWSFLCALLKEEILDLAHETNPLERSQKAERIQAKVTENWLSLPSQFRLEREVRKCSQNAKERDFMVSARLNHLHVLFLLRLHLMQHTSELDPSVVSIAAEILSLAVSAVVLRHQLVNSGTGIVWRVVYYGLPAAGILCLSLLNQLPRMQQDGISITNIFQDLSVLVAEVDSSALVDTRDPNYALLSGAVRTIKVILEKLTFGFLSHHPVDQSDPILPHIPDGQDSIPWIIPDSWDFELDFWTDLVDHPVLLEDENQ